MLKKYPKWLWIASLGFLILVTLGAYFKIFHAEFVYDDFGFIVNNKDIQSFKPFSKFFLSPDIFTGSNYVAENVGGKNWRPISSLVFAIEYRLFGSNPFGFHLISILLHLINIVLVYFLVRKLTNRNNIALAVASLWALHPTLTEAVSWISNQSSLIFFGFFLIAILALLKERFWISYLFFGLSLLSKETALGGIFIFPFIFLLNYRGQEKINPSTPLRIDGEQNRTINFRKVLINSYPFVLIGLAYFYAHYKILGALGDHALRGSFFQNLLLAPAVFYKYIGLAFYPVNLLLDYSNYPLPLSLWDPRVIFGILMFGLLAVLLRLGFKKSWLGFSLGIVWFVAFLLPVLQLIPFQDVIGERFLYTPLVGFFMTAVIGFDYFLNYVKLKFNFNLNAAGKIIFVFVLFIFFILTLNRNNDWLNSENLWLGVLRVDNQNKRALQNISAFYLQKGEADKVIEFSKKLLEIDPENRAGHLHLAVGEIMKGQYKEAEAELLNLIKKYPDFKEAQNNLSILYQQLGRQDSFIDSTVVSPAVEGNIVNSGIAGRVVLLDGEPYEYEASLEIFKSNNLSTPFISVRTHSDGAFQVPLRPGSYILKPMDPDGPIAPVRNSYPFTVGNSQWLQVKIEYK